MQACCDVAFNYAHERKQFGQPIGHNQLLQVFFQNNSMI
jgi:alkylation response protein AidB-like acyl-CoA dehydrogenase